MPKWPKQGFSEEQVEDIVAGLLASGTNASVVYDDENDRLVVDGPSDETIQDVVGGMVGYGLEYDDANDRLIVDGPSNETIEDVVGGMVGYGLEYDDANDLLSATRSGPNPYDAAQSFTESSLTTWHTKTIVEDGSVMLGETSTVDNPDPDQSTTVANGGGFVINPNEPVGSVTVAVNGAVGTDEADVYLSETDGTVLDSAGPVSGGESHTLTPASPLSAGVNYRVYLESSSGGFGVPYRDVSGYPYTSGVVDVVDEYDSDFQDATGKQVWCFDSVTATSAPADGSVTLSWPRPADLYEWDVATFTRTLDGETVDVFVRYSDDGGSTWLTANSGSPIGRNYSLAGDPDISPSSEIRFKAQFSRSNTANNPTLDSVYRSWRV